MALSFSQTSSNRNKGIFMQTCAIFPPKTTIKVNFGWMRIFCNLQFFSIDSRSKKLFLTRNRLYICIINSTNKLTRACYQGNVYELFIQLKMLTLLYSTFINTGNYQLLNEVLTLFPLPAATGPFILISRYEMRQFLYCQGRLYFSGQKWAL